MLFGQDKFVSYAAVKLAVIFCVLCAILWDLRFEFQKNGSGDKFYVTKLTCAPFFVAGQIHLIFLLRVLLLTSATSFIGVLVYQQMDQNFLQTFIMVPLFRETLPTPLLTDTKPSARPFIFARNW